MTLLALTLGASISTTGAPALPSFGTLAGGLVFLNGLLTSIQNPLASPLAGPLNGVLGSVLGALPPINL